MVGIVCLVQSLSNSQASVGPLSPIQPSSVVPPAYLSSPHQSLGFSDAATNFELPVFPSPSLVLRHEETTELEGVYYIVNECVNV